MTDLPRIELRAASDNLLRLSHSGTWNGIGFSVSVSKEVSERSPRPPFRVLITAGTKTIRFALVDDDPTPITAALHGLLIGR